MCIPASEKTTFRLGRRWTLEPLEWRLLLGATPGPFTDQTQICPSSRRKPELHTRRLRSARLWSPRSPPRSLQEDGSNWLSSVTVVATLGSGSGAVTRFPRSPTSAPTMLSGTHASSGVPYAFAIPVDASSLASGRYATSIQIDEHYSGGAVTYDMTAITGHQERFEPQQPHLTGAIFAHRLGVGRT